MGVPFLPHHPCGSSSVLVRAIQTHPVGADGDRGCCLPKTGVPAHGSGLSSLRWHQPGSVLVPLPREGTGGSGATHGLGQEQRNICVFPRPARSWGMEGGDPVSPIGRERQPDPCPRQAAELCRPARRGLSIPVSLTLETSPSPVAWGGPGGYGGLCGAFGSWRRAAHAHGGRLVPDTPRSAASADSRPPPPPLDRKSVV